MEKLVIKKVKRKKCFNLECFKEKYFSKYPDSKIELLEFLPNENIKIRFEDTIKIVNRYYLYKGRNYEKNTYLLRNHDFILGKLESYIEENNLNIKVLEILPKGYFKYSDKFGDCISLIPNFYKGERPKIHAAINKTEYFINQVKEIHGNKYDYNDTTYVNSQTKVKIYCNKHKEFFYSTPSNHLRKRNCPKCDDEAGGLKNAIHSTGWTYSNWEKAANKSKQFDSFKIYIIKCFNDTENFYKIGKTFKTIEKRFHSVTLPYNYEIIKIIEGESKYICELEKKLQKENKDYKYIPQIKFNGMYECFEKLENYEDIFTSREDSNL